MGLLKRLLGKTDKDKEEFKMRLKQAQDEDKIMNLIEERKKSANKRELERYMKEREEEQIKNTLNKIHKKENSELWKSKNSILDKGTSILKDDHPILKEKNIFIDDKTKIPFTSGGENIFFKW